MLKITIPSTLLYDEISNQFINTKEHELQLEHSLVSISKWESKWLKPFLTKSDKTTEETIDYIRCMTLTQNVDPSAYKLISKKLIDQITEYIDNPMTATTFREEKSTANKEIITSEIIYYWMVSFNIPFECQKWHLNKLLALIKVCNIKNQPKKKMSKKERQEQLRNQSAINEARKAKLNTKG